MVRTLRIPAVLLLLIVVLVLLTVDLNRSRRSLFTRSDYWTESHRKTPLGIMAMTLGFRVFAADLLWLDVIQYYGDQEMHREGYRKFYPKIKVITALDPHFIHAYTYGSAILAWNFSYVSEAIDLIQEGVRNNPGTEEARRLSLYLAAITYQQKQDDPRMVRLLEELVQDPHHPAILERMLGLIYERLKQWKKAEAYWEWLSQNARELSIRETAVRHLKKIREKKR